MDTIRSAFHDGIGLVHCSTTWCLLANWAGSGGCVGASSVVPRPDPGMDPSIFPENLEQMAPAWEAWRESSQSTTFMDTNANQPSLPWSRFHVSGVQCPSLHAKEWDMRPFQPSLSNPVRVPFEPDLLSFLRPTGDPTVWWLG